MSVNNSNREFKAPNSTRTELARLAENLKLPPARPDSLRTILNELKRKEPSIFDEFQSFLGVKRAKLNLETATAKTSGSKGQEHAPTYFQASTQTETSQNAMLPAQTQTVVENIDINDETNLQTKSTQKWSLPMASKQTQTASPLPAFIASIGSSQHLPSPIKVPSQSSQKTEVDGGVSPSSIGTIEFDSDMVVLTAETSTPIKRSEDSVRDMSSLATGSSIHGDVLTHPDFHSGLAGVFIGESEAAATLMDTGLDGSAISSPSGEPPSLIRVSPTPDEIAKRDSPEQEGPDHEVLFSTNVKPELAHLSLVAEGLNSTSTPLPPRRRGRTKAFKPPPGFKRPLVPLVSADSSADASAIPITWSMAQSMAGAQTAEPKTTISIALLKNPEPAAIHNPGPSAEALWEQHWHWFARTRGIRD